MATKCWLLLTSFLLLFSCVIYSESFISSESPSVIVIGAGSAGIAAATKLLQNNITNIRILEAENRIGGRIHSILVDEGYIDVGAEQCEGQEGNGVYKMVKNLDLLLKTSIPPVVKLLYSDGTIIENSLSKNLEAFILDYNSVIDKSNTDLNLEENFLASYNSTLVEKYNTDSQKLQIVADTIKLAEHLIIMREGSFYWNQSSAGRHYQVCPGENLNWRNGGYHSFLTFLMKNLQLENKIFLNKQVTRIIWLNHQAKIKTSDTTTYTADHVIVTPSLGVLKHGNICFEPTLPKNKLQAIENLGYGAVIKVFLHFSQKWWNDSFFLFVWSEDDIRKSGKEFPCGFQENGVSWITSVFALRQVVNPNVLVAWISGPLVPEIEQISEDIVKDGVIYVIKKFLGKEYNITEADRVIRTQWYTNPNFYGTNSFEKSGFFNKNISYQTVLAEPILTENGWPIIQFAGEATHPTHYGTAHGAFESGWREAERIINLYKSKSLDNML